MTTTLRTVPAAAAVTSLCVQATRANCIAFYTDNKHPEIVYNKCIKPGAPAAVAATCEFNVRARFEGCAENEHTPPGAFVYYVQDSQGNWGSETKHTFECNSPFITVTWNNAGKSTGNMVNYTFERIEYKPAEPWQNKQLSYTAKFSTKTFYQGYKRLNGELERDLSFKQEEAGGAQIQVWALITGSISNVPVGATAAFSYNGGGHHARVKRYVGNGQWEPLPYGELPSSNRIEDQ